MDQIVKMDQLTMIIINYCACVIYIYLYIIISLYIEVFVRMHRGGSLTLFVFNVQR